jgi:hypothetical protein
MHILKSRAAVCAALLVCSSCVMPEAERMYLPPPEASMPAPPPEDLSGPAVPRAAAAVEAAPVVAEPSDLSDSQQEPVKPPADPLFTTRVPASPALVQLPPPKDLFSVESKSEYNLSCTEFFNLLKTSQPRTIEEALAAIHKVRPKFLNRAVFAYETRMAFDSATLLYPRIIAYGGDAKTILNFGGHPKQRFADRMEMVCFDDKEAKFDFYDVAFPLEEPPGLPRALASSMPAKMVPTDVAALGPEASAALTPEEKKQNYTVIQNGRGVRTCANCHQSPSRPNWDTFALWPGVYGASSDVLRDRESPDTRNIYNSFEGSMWTRFQSMPAKAGRYRFVQQELARPNSDFTLKLSYLNGRRIVGELQRLGPQFETHKYEFAKALFCAPKAERKFFRQLTGDTSVGATFGILPFGADGSTREIFLSAYYDEMQKERRLGDTLSDFSIPNPLPKERFEELRKHYRALLDPNNELNLDMRLSRVDVDEVLMVREIKKVTDKLDIDIENWSMVLDGGYVHENGLGGDGRVALRLILERPFTETFLAADKQLNEAIASREATEQQLFAGRTPASENSSTALEQENAKICGLIERHVK